MNKKTPELILQASTPEELRASLAGLDIDVPARSQGRKPYHAERYSIARLLGALPVQRLSFPLTCTHRDKPDFLLAMADSALGIEHTEAVPENVANAQAMRERGFGPDVYFIPHALPGEPKRTAEELRCEIDADEPDAGWHGDSAEREWAAAMAYYVKAKLPKVMANDFIRYATNWLIVYDNWPLPFINYSNAFSYLAPTLAEMDAFSIFDAIFIHDDSQMCEFREDESIILTLMKSGITL